MAMKTGEPSWRWRRIVIFAVTAFCLWQINGLVDALDSELNRLIAYGLLVLSGVLVLGYAGFATVQDVIAIWRTGRALPYAPPAADEQRPERRE